MATTFKQLLNNDVTTTRTLLHESIPITGSIVSGTYSDLNIKNFSHGIFQAVYDYPFLSSSANHIFDLTVGYSSNSSLSSSANSQNNKKINIYNQMAQVLVGHDITGSILPFDRDGDLLAGGGKLKENIFISFARLLTKDEIKKGSFVIQLGTGSTYSAPFAQTLTLGDYGAQNDFRVNSPAGEYGVLYTSSTGITQDTGVGLVYYQAGIAVITASVFAGNEINSSGETIDAVLTGSTIQVNSDEFRHRVLDIDFNNTTELNSTIYFCRVNHNEFNYSSNPTYLSASKINVKNNTVDEPVSYITTIGLYSADNELLATAKLSEPLKKTPQNELILRVRLDF
jgi:hypothetical protein